MSKEMKSWLEFYDSVPSLMLFGDMTDTRTDEVLSEANDVERLNPIDVVLESVVNILSERISIDQVTSSDDIVLITKDIREMAVSMLLQHLKTEREQKLESLHEAWLSKLSSYLRNVGRDEGNLKLDEVVFRVSSRFRISGLSALRAMSSLF